MLFKCYVTVGNANFIRPCIFQVAVHENTCKGQTSM